jgi:hypothetical protein
MIRTGWNENATITNIKYISADDKFIFTDRSTTGTSQGGLLATTTPQKLLSGGNGVTVSSSTDAIVWTLRTSGYGQDLLAAASSEDNLIITGNNASYQPFLSSSTDGITWVLRTVANRASAGTKFGQIDYNTTIKRYSSGIYVLSSTHPTINSCIITSTNTIVWRIRTLSSSITVNNECNSIKIGDNICVSTWTIRTSGVGSTVAIAASTDTISWTVSTSISGIGTTSLRALAYASNLSRYVASGDLGITATSISLTKVGDGGAGARGAGGGGGGSNPAVSGSGGNGGDGYAKITWW